MHRNYTAADLRAYRENNSCGLAEARCHFERQHFLECVHIAHMNNDFDLLCDVVRELVMKAKF